METTKSILKQVEELCNLIGAYKGKDEKLNDIQSGIDTIRIGIKYLLFNKEADDRENKYLRKLIYDSNR